MKKFLLILLINFFIFISNSYSKQVIFTVAMIDNVPITNIDVMNEILLIKILKPAEKKRNLKNISLQNLIDQALKIEEIKKNNIQISEEILNKNYNNFLLKMKINNLPKIIQKNIFLKIKTEESWIRLIRKKFSWSAYVNIKEIEKNIKNLDYSTKKKDLFKIKDKMIMNEKNKKINRMSNTYLNKLKKEALIKIY